MAIEQKRLKLTLDEVFDILPVPSEEVEIERTNDLGNISDANWNSPLKQFSLGLQNAKETTLSNMIATKLKDNSISLSMLLDFINTSQSAIFSFMLSIIDRLLSRDINNGKSV